MHRRAVCAGFFLVEYVLYARLMVRCEGISSFFWAPCVWGFRGSERRLANDLSFLTQKKIPHLVCSSLAFEGCQRPFLRLTVVLKRQRERQTCVLRSDTHFRIILLFSPCSPPHLFFCHKGRIFVPKESPLLITGILFWVLRVSKWDHILIEFHGRYAQGLWRNLLVSGWAMGVGCVCKVFSFTMGASLESETTNFAITRKKHAWAYETLRDEKRDERNKSLIFTFFFERVVAFKVGSALPFLPLFCAGCMSLIREREGTFI